MRQGVIDQQGVLGKCRVRATICMIERERFLTICKCSPGGSERACNELWMRFSDSISMAYIIIRGHIHRDGEACTRPGISISCINTIQKLVFALQVRSWKNGQRTSMMSIPRCLILPC